ncbi:MAG: hypothetical protein AAFQ98_10280 [Bacteroidota bacterium]
MKNQQNIPCPVCNSPIPFSVQALLSGAGFTCVDCGATVSLSQESSHTVEETMHKFVALKQKVSVNGDTTP